MSFADTRFETASISNRLDHWVAGWRGPLLSALLVLITALPGLIFLPPFDRDESRFAQATAQMLETGDFVNIRYQTEPRDKKPVGIHWLQAASVSLLSSVEKRQIWAYRVPSLLGAMLAAAACAWGASAFFGPRGGLIAGLILGATLLVSSEAFLAKTDAVLCGSTTLAMAALALLYRSGVQRRAPRLLDKLLFWSALALSILDKGPVGPMVVGLSMLSLALFERRWRWIGRIGWGWGLIIVAAVVGPWALAITVTTDGGFWTGAVGGDLAPKLKGGHEGHAAPPGAHLLALPLLFFPATAIIPAAFVAGCLRRMDPGVRFALAWLIPSWIVFEALPTKLIHYPMPLYGALAWLAAAALTTPIPVGWGRLTRWIGASLSLLVGILVSAAMLVLAPKYGLAASPWVVLTTALFAGACLLGALFVLSRRAWPLAGGALGLGVMAHMAATGGLAPTIHPLWVSSNAAALVRQHGLDPRNGVTPGPVVVVGYAEPSLIFLLGTATELDTPEDAADAVADGEPALVEQKEDAAFRQTLKATGASATLVGETKGVDYSIGKTVDLLLYRSNVQAPKEDENGLPATTVRTAGRPGA